MTTWSFNDWGVRDALVEAAKRGATVRIIAAEGINKTGELPALEVPEAAINRLKRGNFSNPDPNNIARECSGSCRGGAGTPHSKFFLFDDVGSCRARNIVIQTSMNLTRFAFNGQWNQATVSGPERLYNLFRLIHNQMAERGGTAAAALRAPGCLGRDQHLLSRGAVPRRDPVMPRCSRVQLQAAAAAHPDPGHPVRHPRRARQPHRQEAAQPVERRVQRADHLLASPAVRCSRSCAAAPGGARCR